MLSGTDAVDSRAAVSPVRRATLGLAYIPLPSSSRAMMFF